MLVLMNKIVLVQFGCGTRILRVIHGRDARATLQTEPGPTRWVSCMVRRDSFERNLSVSLNP